MINFFLYLIFFIFTVNLLVIVHEFGHFLIAKICGVTVEHFSIGFGKELYIWYDRYNTKYSINAIPLGGYIKMFDEKTKNVEPEKIKSSFNYKNVWQRIAIIFAGPIFNFIFAIFIYWLVFIIGINSYRPIVNNVISGSIASEAGILSGMEFKYINNIKTPDWNAVRLQLIKNIGMNKITIELIKSYNNLSIEKKIINLNKWSYKLDKYEDPIIALGIIPYTVDNKVIITKIKSQSEADKAGLRYGDKIIKICNKKIDTWSEFLDFIKKNSDNLLKIKIERQGKKLNINLLLNDKLNKFYENQINDFFGIVIPEDIISATKYQTVIKFKVLSSFIQAIKKTWELVLINIDLLYKLINGNVKLNNISGPISISHNAIISAKRGLIYYFIFLAILSINLGVMNLIPLSILDGSRLLFLLIEVIKNKPISEYMQYYYYRISSIFLILLMCIAFWNDLSN